MYAHGSACLAPKTTWENRGNRSRSIRNLGTLWPLLLGFCLWPGSSAHGQAEYRGEIRQGTLFKIPIAVREWFYNGVEKRALPNGGTCEEVLLNDLVQSDFFNVKTETFFVPRPGDSLNAATSIKAVATGEVHKRLGKVLLEGQLLDSRTEKVIFRKTYPLGDPPDRSAIHGFSDDIVLYLTGERGVAQTRIAFVGNATGFKEIYLVDSDGARVEMVTSLRSITVSPRWSPKGDKLAFTSFAHGNPDLYAQRLGDGKVWPVSARPGMNSAPCWHPDGEHLAASLSFEGNSELYLLEAEGRGLRRLTFESSIETAPSFDPKGNRITFTSDRSGEPQIYVMDADGTNVRRLSFVGKHCDSPDWSPKGDRILFVALIDRVFDICTIRPDGGDLRRLTGGGGNHENPRWAPDGRHLVFAQQLGGSRRLFVMAADGSGTRQLTYTRGDQYNPSWSPPLGSARD